MQAGGVRVGAAGGHGSLWWAILLVALACGWPVFHVRADEAPDRPKTFPVDVKDDITYCNGLEADLPKHQLDLYLPTGLKDFPVLFFVHGGSWTIGDKKGDLGVYQVLGRAIARQGVGVVIPNYRLSPRVQHPAHVQDVARALAWTVKHIGKHGGRTDALFISGHSAGGHLVSLLATDPSFLKAEGLSAKAIRGVISISGVYEVPQKRLFDGVFGKDPVVRKNASPLCHVRGNLPRFLVLCADQDLPICCKKAGDAFCTALAAKNNLADSLEFKDRNHISIMFSMVSDQDPARGAILNFVRKNTPPSKKQ